LFLLCFVPQVARAAVEETSEVWVQVGAATGGIVGGLIISIAIAKVIATSCRKKRLRSSTIAAVDSSEMVEEAKAGTSDANACLTTAATELHANN